MLPPIFYPGQILQGLSTFIFYLVIAAFLAGGTYIWFQEKRIDGLQNSLADCTAAVEAGQNNRTFMEENLRVLKRSCARKTKPAVVEGKLKLENLFNGPVE